jgi:phosphatidylglycerophosphatase A
VLRAVARVYATGLGTGFFPVAPGTAGSLLAVALYAAVPALPLGSEGTPGVVPILFVLALTLLGVPASRWGEEEFGEDGGPIVIDEVVGQWITLMFLPPTPLVLVAGFLLFRAFDIFKPWPAGRSQAWVGGWGVMADDVFAGVYAAVALRLVLLGVERFAPTAGL